jgi:hypothetical protein
VAVGAGVAVGVTGLGVGVAVGAGVAVAAAPQPRIKKIAAINTPHAGYFHLRPKRLLGRMARTSQLLLCITLITRIISIGSIGVSGSCSQHQEKLPLYLGFFEFVHNARKRGKALLGALLETLLK